MKIDDEILNKKITMSEIFKSIDGEGSTSGLPATFVRTYGCNVMCSYCDSLYAVNSGEAVVMTIDEIVSQVRQLGVPRVTITGGEPLIQPAVADLIHVLLQYGYLINIETNGTINVNNFFSEHPGIYSRVHITLDYKCKSSEIDKEMNMSNFIGLKSTDIIKFVVGSKDDLKEVEEILQEYPSLADFYISPIFGRIEPKEIVEYMLASNVLIRCNARLQLQIHKLIWPADMRGV